MGRKQDHNLLRGHLTEEAQATTATKNLVLATRISAGCYCGLKRSEKLIKN